MTTERNVFHPPWLQDGKAATDDLIRAYGGQVAAEQLTGKGQSRLSAYGGRNTDAFAPVDVVAKLERSTHGCAGHPHVTRWLCRNAGGVRVRRNTIRIAGLPAAFDGFTLLHLSDLHADMSGPAMARVAEILPGLSYDLCVLTGDYRGKTFGPFDAAITGVARVLERVSGPVYGVLGNHDTIQMVPDLVENYEANPGPFQFHDDASHVRRWMASKGYLFCRKGEVREIMRPIPIPDPDGAPDAGRWGLCDGIHRDDHEFVPA